MDYRTALAAFAELLDVGSHALKRMTEAEKASSHSAIAEGQLDELLEISKRLAEICTRLQATPPGH